ncbi:hypothetical protein V1503_07855 [Bacillus sp. SCS-151]|uniref:hypothetical protein n=1 Tax=Nanhaiella sioensis TaxID=3115293 RepID=UPI00397A3670
MTSTLSWTKFGPLEEETTILDPLAFNYFAQVLGNVILPSFTTRTSRARYYSMVCYGIYISNLHLKKKDKINYEKDVLNAFKLYERFWARAIVEHYKGKLSEGDGKERDFRGKRPAISSYKDNTFSLHYPFLTRQLELGGLGAYRTSLEDLELIKEDLSLTHKGLKLAENFVNTSRYDKLVLQAMNKEKIVFKEGNATIKSFGFHGSLDATTNEAIAKKFVPSHQDEIILLKEYILDHPKNAAAVTFIYENQSAGKAIDVIVQISNKLAQTEQGTKVIDGFKTVLAFEQLVIIINRIWCAIIRTAEEHLGTINVTQAVSGCRDYLDILTSEGQYIKHFLEQKEYMIIANSLHGSSFAVLLNSFQKMSYDRYCDFLIELIKYHASVMKRRNSGPWIILDGNDIVVTTGYDYPKKTEKLPFLHSFKIPNILTLIKDTGWVPSDKVY